MKFRFFYSLLELQRFTLQLRFLQHSVCCPFCGKALFLYSHGFVYKKSHWGKLIIIGKRIFCSNRYGHGGCGRTQRLFLASRIPRLHYSAHHLALFILGLISNLSVRTAYQKATRCNDPRNAWRWLSRIHLNLFEYLSCAHFSSRDPPHSFPSRSLRLQTLLPSLNTLFRQHNLRVQTCCFWQLSRQTAFC